MPTMTSPLVIIMLAQLIRVSDVSALTWAPMTPEDNAAVYACVTSDVTLNWTLSVTSEDEVLTIVWQKAVAGSRQLVAMSYKGRVTVPGRYSGRVQHTGNAGIVILNTTTADSGEYVVLVHATRNHTLHVSLNRTVVLTIGDGLMTLDGQLHAQQRAEAVYDVMTRDWHVTLQCGTFVYRDTPPFSLQWTDPNGQPLSGASYHNGQPLSGDSYHNGQFLLKLDNPVTGGIYTCSLPASSAASACLRHNESDVTDTVLVDDVKARLTLLETEHRHDVKVLRQMLKEKLLTFRNETVTHFHNNEARVSQVNSTLTTVSAELKEYLDENVPSCKDWLKFKRASGVRTIRVLNEPISVFCDQTTDGKGWIVFQRRVDASVDFYRDWASYRDGFGNLNGNFWLGLDKIQKIASTDTFVLRVDLMDGAFHTYHATYSNFRLGTEAEQFTLHFDNFTGGNAKDGLTYHKGMRFSTKDRDNDVDHTRECANVYHGGWWYYKCFAANLNGVYKPDGKNTGWDGLNWFYLRQSIKESMKFVEMKMRQV